MDDNNQTEIVHGYEIKRSITPPVPEPEEKPLDKVKEPTPRKRSRERGER